MNIHVCLITYAVDPYPLVSSVGGADITWHLFTHSENMDIRNSIGNLADAGHKIYLNDWGKNRGLSRSWNDFLIDAQGEKADAMLIVNDDILGTHADLVKLAQAAIDHRDYGMVVVEGYDIHWQEQRILGYGIFAVNPVAIEQIGYFDENCSPFCFEDSDYSRRCALSDIKFFNVGPTEFQHLGSQATKLVPALYIQNQKTFPATQRYYEEKWGGKPGDEEFTFPFDAAMYNLRISADERHNPYPDHKRTDLEDLVKI